MTEFKVGDVVVCEREGEPPFPGLLGQQYTVTAVRPTGSINIDQGGWAVTPDRFRLVQGADPVNHPSHYTWLPNGVEVIDITKHLSFCLGNVVKYTLRADRKGNAIEDLKKAQTYLKFEIERREEIARRDSSV